MSKNDDSGCGCCCCSISLPSLPVTLFLIFMVLKLCDQIDWSWWWVTAPLWISAGLALVAAALFVMLFLGSAAVCGLIERSQQKKGH